MMNKTNIQLTVTRNGYLDDSYYQAQARQEIIMAVMSHFGRVYRVLTQPFRNLAYNVKKEASLALYDALHNTDYRQRYHQKIEAYHRQQFERRMGFTS